MPLLTRFDTPGGLRDFPAGSPFYGRWHDRINAMVGRDPRPGSAAPEPGPIGVSVGEFYNPTVTPVNAAGERLLVWMGFPRELLIANRDQRQRAFERGDTRGATETTTEVEYLEWHVSRDKVTNKITNVTFVTETPEYWQEMFNFDRNRVLQLYQELVSPSITMANITRSDGSYDPLNEWNTSKGIVHYIVTSPANTLGAAVGLAQGSVRLTGARHVKDNYELSGGARTSADPRVGFDVNMLARKGLSVTGREAIGLYLVDWDDTGWTKPDGSPVGNYWRVVRGKPGAALRLEYEVPASERVVIGGVSKPFSVGDISIGGRPIAHGGHLAEHVTVMIGGLAGLH